jgi:hypothetical protein
MSGRQISAIVCTQLELASQQLSGHAGVEDRSRWCVARKKTGRSIMPHTHTDVEDHLLWYNLCLPSHGGATSAPVKSQRTGCDA